MVRSCDFDTYSSECKLSVASFLHSDLVESHPKGLLPLKPGEALSTSSIVLEGALLPSRCYPCASSEASSLHNSLEFMLIFKHLTTVHELKHLIMFRTIDNYILNSLHNKILLVLNH